MKIGNLEITTPVFLAPMAGVTDTAYCILAQRMGCGLVYSEMVSDQGINFRNERTLEMLKTVPEQRPLAIQLFSGNPERMYKAASFVASLNCCDMIDINMGCPAPKIVRNNEGSALMKDPVLAYEIMCATREAVKDMPVTVKMRKGWDSEHCNVVEMAGLAQKAGLDAIAVHGRTREEFYRGHADWDIIREVKQAVDIPVIGNGDVTTPQRAQECFDRYGVDAIMIGRASFGRPWIFKEVKHYLKTGEELPPLSFKWKMDVLRREVQDSVNLLDERRGILHVRRHLAASPLFKGIPNFKDTRIAMLRAETLPELNGILDHIESTFGGE